jgi:hypothetical protein
MTNSRPLHPTFLFSAFMLSLNLGVVCWAQDPPPVKPDAPIDTELPFQVDPPITTESPSDSATTPSPPSNQPGTEEDKPPFPPSADPNKEDELSDTEAPFKDKDIPLIEPSPSPSSGRRAPTVPNPGFPPRLLTVDMEIAEVKRLALLELDRLKIRGQYTTTMASSQLSKTRQEDIAMLREAVACSKNLVLGKRISLVAFLDIQRQSIHAELALARTSSMRVAILRKAIEACAMIEMKVRSMDVTTGGEIAPLFKKSDVDLVVVQREHWEQLLKEGNSTSLITTSNPIESVLVGSNPVSTVYCPKVRRRR